MFEGGSVFHKFYHSIVSSVWFMKLYRSSGLIFFPSWSNSVYMVSSLLFSIMFCLLASPIIPASIPLAVCLSHIFFMRRICFIARSLLGFLTFIKFVGRIPKGFSLGRNAPLLHLHVL